jgi:hypothetical protein
LTAEAAISSLCGRFLAELLGLLRFRIDGDAALLEGVHHSLRVLVSGTCQLLCAGGQRSRADAASFRRY